MQESHFFPFARFEGGVTLGFEPPFIHVLGSVSAENTRKKITKISKTVKKDWMEI